MRNHFSLISAGTEGSTVRAARKSLLGKARERPQQVKHVIDALHRIGPIQTYRAVSKKLDGYSPLGYSCAGEVLDVGARVQGYTVGDRVACAGIQASHAEVVSVPANLCVPLACDSNLRCACYNTLGAIALQGVRQADLRLGESCLVIGLGLIGQLTCLLLRASGIRVFGVDVHAEPVQLARRYCADAAWVRSDEGIEQRIHRLTNGIGADAVIITAATTSLDPINFAGKLARHKGRVVVVGDVPTGFDREPDYYHKELELRMSCSYGPGRHDLDYEQHGRDYPAGYVRWTENRNMQAFHSLINDGRIDLSYLTTHEFALEDAPRAYDLIVNQTEPFLGIVLRYDTTRPLARQPLTIKRTKPVTDIGIAFVGAGSYAQANLLPNLPQGDPSITLRSVMAHTGTTSKRVAERYGFEQCVSSIDELYDEKTNVWFIATRHDTHADYVRQGLSTGKHIFVEKPLAINREELETIRAVYLEARDEPPIVMVGYNRRFSPLAVELKRRLSESPLSMIYRVNAGPIAADSWIHDPVLGGGRMIGEGCHFVDFMTYLCGSKPVSVAANVLPDAQNLADTLSVQLTFENGSIGTLHYFANGSKSIGKEYCEVYQDGATAILDDFKSLRILGCERSFRKRLLSQNKGQSEMIAALLTSLKSGGTAPIPFDDLVRTTLVTFAALESATTQTIVTVDLLT